MQCTSLCILPECTVHSRDSMQRLFTQRTHPDIRSVHDVWSLHDQRCNAATRRGSCRKTPKRTNARDAWLANQALLCMRLPFVLLRGPFAGSNSSTLATLPWHASPLSRATVAPHK